MSTEELFADRIGNAVIITMVLMMCVGLTVWMVRTSPASLAQAIAQLTLVAIIGITVLAALPRTTVGPLCLVVGAMLLSYVVRPAQLIIQTDVVTYAAGLSVRRLPVAVAYACVLAASFAVGYLLPISRTVLPRLPVPENPTLTSRRSQAVAFCLILIVAGGYAVLVRLSGLSFVDGLRNPVAFRAATSSQGAFYLSGLVLWCIWTFFYLQVLTPRVSRLVRYVAVSVSFVVCMVLTFPFGSRGFLIIPVLFLVALAQLRKPGQFGAVRLMVLVGCLMIGAGLYAVFRESQGAQGPGRTTSAAALDLGDAVARAIGRFDSIDFFTWTLEAFPSTEHGFRYGRSILDLAALPVPRAVLPSKPSQTSAWLMEQLLPRYDRTFTPEFGLVAELYINGWIPAIIFGGVVFGLAMQLMDSYVWMHRHNDAVLLWYGGCLSSPLGWLLAGVNSFATILFAMNSFFCVVLLIGLRERRVSVRAVQAASAGDRSARA